MKKRILTVALVVALLATCFAGTYAYLQDSEAQKNTFTTGNVYITLDEAKVKKEEATGNLVADGTTRIEASKEGITGQNYHLFPGMIVTKNPTITLDAESENAWIAAKITIKGAVLDLIKDEDGKVDFSKIASGGVLFGNTVTLDQVDDAENKTCTLYVYVNAKQAASAEVVLFTTLTIPTGWDNAEMDKVDGMTIDVEAYAVQANGFANCQAAMQAAFPAAFAN